MADLKRAFLVSGLIFLVFLPIWMFAITPRLFYFPKDHYDFFVFEGTIDFAQNSSAPLERVVYLEKHTEKVTDVNGDILDMELTTKSLDVIKQVDWEMKTVIPFNRKTLRIEDTDAFLFFSMHLEKRNYRVKVSSYLPEDGAVFRFAGESFVHGLKTYKFTFDAKNLDWSESYQEEGFGDVPKVLADDSGTVWVEPLTGTIVKHEEGWDARIVGGQYDGKQIDVGSMQFDLDSITNRVRIAEDKIQKVIWYERVIPITLALISLVCFITSFLLKEGRRKKHYKK